MRESNSKRYQLSRFLALVSNRSIAHEATEKALKSEGSAMRENAAYMESYEARINLMKTAWQEFSLAMGDAVIGDTIIALTNSLASLAGVFTNVVDKFGLLPPIIAAAGIALVLLSSKFRAFSLNLVTAGVQLTGFTAKTNTAKIGLQGLAASAKAANVSVKSLLASTGIGLVFVGLGFALEKLIGLWAKASEEQDNYFDNLKQNSEEIKSNLKSLNEIEKKLSSTNLTQSEQNDLYKELTGLTKSVISHYTSEGDAVYKTKEAIEELIKVEKKRLAIQRELANRASLDTLGESSKKINESIEDVRKYSAEYNKALAESNAAGVARDFINENNMLGDIDAKDYIKLVAELKEKIRESFEKEEFEIDPSYLFIDFHSFFTNLDQVEERFNEIDSNIEAQNQIKDENIGHFISAYKELASLMAEKSNIGDTNALVFLNSFAEEYANSADYANKTTTELESNFKRTVAQMIESTNSGEINFSEMVKTDNFDTLIKKFPQYEAQIKKFAEQLYSIPSGAKAYVVLDDAGNEIKRFADRASLASSGLEILHDTFDRNEEGIVSYTVAQTQSADVMEDYSKIIDSTISELSELNNIIYKVSQGESLNGTEVDKLIRAYPKLEKSIIKTADGYSIEESALELVRVAKLDYLEATQLAEAGIDAAVYNGLSNRLKNYGIELDAIQSLAEARNAAFKMMDGKQDIMGYIPSDDEVNAMRQLNTLGSIRETFNKLYAQPTFGVTPSKSSSSKSKTSKSDKDDPKFQDATDAHINAINKQADAQAKLNEQAKQSIDNDESIAIQLKKTTNLYNGQIKEIEELQKANNKLWDARTSFINSTKYDKHTMASWVDENGNATESFISLYNSMKSGSAQDELQALYDKYLKYTLAIRENRDEVTDLLSENKELLKSLQALREENTRNWIEKKTEAYQKYQDAIIASQRAQMRYHEEGSDGWFKEQQKQIDAYKEWQEALSKDNDIYRARIKQSESGREEDALTEQQLKDLEAQIKANSDAWWQYEEAIISANKAIKDQREQAANKIVENFKKMLQKQKELELKAIDARMKAEDERHQKVMKHYDDELNAFRAIINAQLDALDRENDTEDYERELSKLLDEQAEVQGKINVIANDDSYEAKAKRKELQEQLREIQERIEEKQRDRSRNLERQALEDQLSDREKYIDNLKDLEDQSHDKIKENLDAEKTLRDEYWNSIIENEQYFSKLKQDLMSNDVSVVQSTLSIIRSEYGIFFSYLRAQAEDLGNMFNTINDNFKVDYDNIKMPTITAPTNNSGSNNSTGGQTSSQDLASAEVINAWSEYLINKQRAEAMGSKKGAEFDRLKARNDELRAKYGFKDGSYSQLKSKEPIFSAETGGMTAAWGKEGKFALLHEKELVLNKTDTSNILNIVNVARNIVDSVKQLDFTKMFTTPSPVVADSGTTINHLSIEINGSQIKDGRTAADEIVGGLLKRGIKIGRG